VEVAADNSHAKVFFTTLGNDAQVQSCQRGLERAAGFLRSQLAARLSIRTVPVLHFEFDASIDRGMRLSKLIDDAIADDAKHPGEEE
jgi:ribosome-binding factor A